MTNDGRNSDQELQVLTQVLDAEKHAHKSLDDARMEAESILRVARNAVRSIEARTDRRIQNLHNQFREKLAREKLHREKGFMLEKNTHGKPFDTDKVKQVTKRLSYIIVGATPNE